MIKIADKHTLAFSFVVTLIIMIAFVASMFLFAGIFNVDLTNIEYNFSFYAVSILGKIIFCAFVILVLIILKMQYVMKLTSKGLLNGFVLGWFFIVLGIILFVADFDFSKINAIDPGKWLLLIPIAVETILTGISEEFLCRGFLYNVMRNRYKNIKKAVFASSAIFGVIHLINLIHQPVHETLLQVAYAFAFGVLLTAIYVRCENIWAAVSIHALFNFFSAAGAALTPNENIAEAFDIISTIPIFIILILAVCLGMFLLRTKKMRLS